MRSGIALMLTMSLATAPHAAAQELLADPIARAIRHEGARLAAYTTDASESALNQYDHTDWSPIVNLRRGTALLVTVKNERRQRWFVRADEARLVVRDDDYREETIVRGDVARVAVTSIRGSKRGAAGSAAVAALLGSLLALHLALDVRCQPSCGGVVAGIWLSAVGLPVGAGFAGYYGFGEKIIDVIYRAPNDTPIHE